MSLVDEQHPTEGSLDQRLHVLACPSHIWIEDSARWRDLDHVPLRQQAQRPIQAGKQAGDGRLARAGRTREDHVHRLRRERPIMLIAVSPSP